jgi:flagellar biosynthesis regulator FlaF
MKDLVDALWASLDVLEKRNIPYVVMGGLAVRVHGIPRATYDVDFTIALARELLPSLYDALEDIGLAIPEVYRSGWVDQVAGMPFVKARLYVDGKSTDVDMFLAEAPYQADLLARRVESVIFDRKVWIASVEDLVLLKLIANRLRDQADIADIRMVQGSLDEAYMRRWAPALGITDRLESLLSSAPL